MDIKTIHTILLNTCKILTTPLPKGQPCPHCKSTVSDAHGPDCPVGNLQEAYEELLVQAPDIVTCSSFKQATEEEVKAAVERINGEVRDRKVHVFEVSIRGDLEPGERHKALIDALRAAAGALTFGGFFKGQAIAKEDEDSLKSWEIVHK